MKHLSPNPHNDFFYAVMSRKELATAFFKKYLPQNMQNTVNLDTLTICESKSISDSGKTLHKDVLYQCNATKNQTAYLYILCEHQSHLEQHMPLRILEYNTSVIRKHLKNKGKNYPLFINFVIYHGSKPWNYSTRLGDYYIDKELGEKRLYMAPFTLINLPQEDDEALYNDKQLGFFLTALKCTKTPDPYLTFTQATQHPTFHANFQQLPRPLKVVTLTYIGRFIDNTRYQLENFINLTIQNQQEQQQIMTSIIGQIEQRSLKLGEQRGKQEGIKLGEQRGIKLGEQRGIKLGEQRGLKLGKQATLVELIKKGLLTQQQVDELLKDQEGK